MTQSGIEPATFQFVVQRLNHCATAVPIIIIIIINLKFSGHIFEKYSNTKFHKYLSSGSLRSDGWTQTEMTTLTVALLNSAKAPEKK